MMAFIAREFSMKKMLSALLAGSLLCFNASAAYADPPMSAFYDGVMKMAPQGKQPMPATLDA